VEESELVGIEHEKLSVWLATNNCPVLAVVGPAGIGNINSFSSNSYPSNLLLFFYQMNSKFEPTIKPSSKISLILSLFNFLIFFAKFKSC